MKIMMPLSATLFVFSTEVLAHPGHDHSHWSSPLLHSLLAITLLGVASAGAWAYYRHSQKQNQTNQEEK